MKGTNEKRLVEYWEAAAMLSLTLEQIQWLVDTRQLREIRICGEKRLDQRDLDRLLTFYQKVQERGKTNAHQSREVRGR